MRKIPIKEVEGAYLIELDRHDDNRGSFQELFSSIRYDANLPHVAQTNLSRSHKGVVRGLHVAPFAKLCTCVSGSMFDVIADVRSGSKTEGKWFGVWLDGKGGLQVYVPPGCAHGFFAAENDTLLLYNQDGLYNPSLEWGVHWRDPTLAVEWPVADEYILSEKDKQAKEWRNVV